MSTDARKVCTAAAVPSACRGRVASLLLVTTVAIAPAAFAESSVTAYGGFGKRLGIRFEARGYAALLSNNGGLFCGGNKGCVITINGPALYQAEGLEGLSLRF